MIFFKLCGKVDINLIFGFYTWSYPVIFKKYSFIFLMSTKMNLMFDIMGKLITTMLQCYLKIN